MPRVVDFHCPRCDVIIPDRLIGGPNVEIEVHCLGCGQPAEVVWWGTRRRTAQWDDHDAVVVYRKPDGTISYPGRNDLVTPKGCERVVMRSLREVEKFERDHGVRSEMAWYDKGSGRGFDDHHRGEPI